MPRRIRSIKPEILDDEVTAALPHLEWRLFVSLWLLADDYGNLHGRDAQIKGAALWATDDSLARVREALARLSDAGLIASYKVRGQSYLHICGWTKHQKVDHPGKAVIPGPSQADSTTCDVSRNTREDSRESREGLATDQDQDRTKDQDQDQRAPRGLAIPDPVSDLWERQERHRATNPKLRPLKLTPSRRREVAGRVKDHGVEACEAVVDRYADEAERTGDWQYFDGVTNWRAANVDRAVGRLGTDPRAGPSPAGTANHRPLTGLAATAEILAERAAASAPFFDPFKPRGDQ